MLPSHSVNVDTITDCLELTVSWQGRALQGRIKGPRLDTVMGPYPFSSPTKLSSTTHSEFLGIAPGKF